MVWVEMHKDHPLIAAYWMGVYCRLSAPEQKQSACFCCHRHCVLMLQWITTKFNW